MARPRVTDHITAPVLNDDLEKIGTALIHGNGSITLVVDGSEVGRRLYDELLRGLANGVVVNSHMVPAVATNAALSGGDD